MRLHYIDKLKALAMLMVVLGHTIYFCTWHENVHDDALLQIICTFHVPLFFFLSGFVIKEPAVGNKLANKVRRFMVPMVIVGFINALLICKVKDFFLTSGHNGYWYLLTLTSFYLLLLVFLFNPFKKRIPVFLTDIVTAIIIWWLLIKAFKQFGTYCEPLNLDGAFIFWPYFVAGHLCRKYQLEKYIIEKRWLTFFLLLFYLAFIIACYSQLDSLPFYLEYAIAFVAIAALLALFHHFDNSHTFLDRQLTLIGNHTLSIYVYHYFFIRFIQLDFLQTSNLLTRLLVIIPLTLIIAYGSMAIGRLVQKGLDLLTK